MPDLTEIPATFESSPTEIPATFEAEAVEIPASYDEGAPEVISQSIRSAKSQDEAIQLALPHFNSPDRINLAIQSLAEKKKADDARTGIEKVSDVGAAMLNIPGVGVDLFKHIREGVLPAVAQAVADLVDPLTTPAQIRAVYANAGEKMSPESLKRLAQEKRQDLNRGAARSAAEIATAVKSTSLQSFEILRNLVSNVDAKQAGLNVVAPGIKLISDVVNLNSPGVTKSDDEYRAKSFEDLVAAQSIREAAEGKFTESAAETAAAGYPIRPEQVQGLETVVDLTNLVPGVAGAKAGAVAAKAEIAARSLRSAAAAPKPVGLLRAGVGAGLEATGKRLVSASDSPVATGLLAGATAAASGLDPSGVALATILGSSNRSMGIASSALEKGGNKLLRMAGKAKGTVALGPLGAAVELTGQFFDETVREGAKNGLLASLPFVLGQKDEEGAVNVATTGAAFGATGAATANAVSTVANAARSFPLDNFFRDRSADRPDTDYVAPEFTHYSDDHSNVLESASRSIFDSLSNKDKQNFEALKTLVGAPDANGVTTQIFAVDRQTGDAFVKQAGLRDQLGAGVTIEPNPGQTVRTILINVDAENGIAAGHEVGHAVEMSLPPEIRKQLYDLVDPNSKKSLVDRDDFEGLRQYYETLFNRRRNPDGTFTEVPQNERRTFDDAAVVSEYIAENFSAFLNGVPPGKLGTPRPLFDRMRLQLGAMLEKAGSRRLTTQGESKLQSKLGLKPSFALAQAFQNYLEAGRLDNLRLPGEPPVLIRPPEAPTERATNAPAPANAPVSPLANIREVEAKPVVPGFKKGDPIGEIRDRDGMLIAEDAKVLRKNEDGTYEIEFIDPDTGKRLIATTDEASLVSPISPGKVDPNKTVFPASPVTPQTPFGAATAPTPPTAATTVAPKQVENVARPQGSVATPSLRPGAASAFVKKAPDTLHSANRQVLEGLMSAPRAEIPAVETDYYAAASPVQSPDAIVRAAQRKAADALEKSGEPNPFRAAFQKLFVPYRWSSYKLDAATNARLYGEGAPRQPGGIYGMSVDKVGQNLDLLRGLAKETPAVAKTLSDFGVSPEYLASDALVSDFRTYLDNQAHGYGGDGKKLSRPADTRPGTVTVEDPNFVPVNLPANKRQLFNLLLNLEQQATRTPGMEFSARFAKQNGIDPLTVGFDEKGRPLTDNNALRAALLQKGFDPRLLNSAVENLPTENFTSAIKVRPDVAMPAADVAITQAGFMPETGRADIVSELERAIQSTGYSGAGYYALDAARRLAQDPSSDSADILRNITSADVSLGFGHPAHYAISNAKRLAGDLDLGRRSTGRRFMPETPARRPQGNDETRSVAAQYTQKAGIQAAPHDTYAPTNETTLKRIADFYENAKHEPEKPEVQKAYRALAEETRAQYDEMVANGIEIEPYEGKGEPYANSAAMLADIRDNKHLYFFLTKNAFGEGADSGNNALLEKSGIKINGVDLLYNDLFRAVHDYFGHTAEGFEFGPRGEYNAYLAHSRMFSDEAKPALAAETLAQNAWVNFGPQLRRADGSLPKAGDADFVPIAKRRFADQKNTVVPPELLQAADPQAAFMPEDSQLEGFGESMREKMRAKMAKVEPSGYEEGDRLELPSGKIVEFVSDLLPKKGGARDGAQMAYVRFEDGMESSVYLDDLTKTYGPGGSFMPEAPESPEFKAWFGDWQDPQAYSTRAKGPVSYVVDWKAGRRPLRVYHSSVGDFNAFESGRPTFDDMGLFGNVETNRHAIFFSDSPEQANSYVENRRGKPYEGAKTYPAYLDIKSPADFTSADPWTLAEEAGVNPRWIQNKQTWELFDGKEGKEFVEGLKKAGYDGAIFTEDAVREGVTPGTTYAVFEPTQIKSATGNSGTFDATNPDIRYMPEAQFDAPKRLPDAIKDRTLTLVHKGPAGVGELDPARFGKSGITPRSELAGEPRVFFYVKGFENKGDPSQLRGNTYEIPVSGKRIYDGDTDALDWTQDVNRQRADIMLKDAGYAGLIRTRGKGKNLFKQVEIFEKVSVDGTPVSETDVRTPRNRLETPEGRKVAAQLREKFGSTGAYFDRLNEYKETGNVRFMPEAPDTPEFKRWFGDSRVVDESGNPKPVFHSTPVPGFDEFKRVSGKDRGVSAPPSLGFHFGSPEAAEARLGSLTDESTLGMKRSQLGDQIAPATYPVFLKADNLLRMSDLGDWQNTDRIGRHLVRDGVASQSEVDAALATRGKHVALQKLIQSKGYDGIVYKNDFEDAGSDSYIVFEPTQIKSATGNSGAFDPANPDIRFMPEATPQETGDYSNRIDTRVVTSKKAVQDPSQFLNITAKEVIENPKKVTVIGNLVKDYPGLPSKGKAADVVAELHKLSVDNLLWLHDRMPEEFRQRSKLWYDGGRKLVEDWSEKYDTPRNAVAGVMAALSPQKDWFMNVDLARRTIELNRSLADKTITPGIVDWFDAKFGEKAPENLASLKDGQGKKYSDLSVWQKAVFLRAFDEQNNPRNYPIVNPEGTFAGTAKNANGNESKVAWGDFGSISKAIGILTDPTRANVSARLGQEHKVRNFYNNLLLPNESTHGDVTIDTHAVAAALLRPLSGSDIPVLHNFGGGGAPSSAFTGASGTYGLHADAYREAAQKRGILPREMQSITWEAVRGLFVPEFKTEKNRRLVDAIWTDYENKKIDANETRNRIEAVAGGIRPPSWSVSGSGGNAPLEAAGNPRGVLADVAERDLARPTGRGNRNADTAPLAGERVGSEAPLANESVTAQYMPEGLDGETAKGQKGGMNKTDLAQSLLDAGFTANEYDSTNAWGYAGSKGTKYVKDNAEVLVANAYTRGGTAFDTSFVTVTFKGPSPVKKVSGRVHDDLQDKKSFERVARILKIEGLLN